MGKVTALMMDVITEKSGHSIVPNAVSVCLTPCAPSPVPIPYPVVGSSVEGITDPPMRTKVEGEKFATTGSVIKTCHGNEPGTLKETCSFNTSGPCFIILGAPTVLCELGMMGITGAMCISNKAITVGAGGSASGAGGAGGPGGGAGGGGAGGGGPSGPSGPSNGGGGGGGGNSGASASAASPGARGSGEGASPGAASGPPEQHQCQNGHPVDMGTGDVVDVAVDIQVPGPIPFSFKRLYSSARRNDVRAQLGPGWAHNWELSVWEEAKVTVLRDAEGRSIFFEQIPVGGNTFHRGERKELKRLTADRWEIFDLATRWTYRFEAFESGGQAALKSVSDAWNNRVELVYEDGRLTTILDAAGREVCVSWSGPRVSKLDVRVGGASEQTVDYAYTEAGCLAAVTDALGHTETFEYDAQRRMVATTLKTGVVFRYEYEADTARCARTWGPKGLYDLTFSYEPENHRTFADGEEPRVYTTDDDGHVIREAVPSGVILVERAYDQDGFLIAEVNGAGEGTKYWHDARGNLVREVGPDDGVTAWEYDARDLAIRKAVADGTATHFSYDDRGALMRVSFPTGRWNALTHDDHGRLVRVDDASGTVASYSYDSRHGVATYEDAVGARTTFGSDGMGRPVYRSDALGRTTRVMRNALGLPTLLVLPDGRTVSRSYDPNGNIAREVAPNGDVSTLTFGGMNVLTQFVAPDGGVWRFSYTTNERLAEVKDPKGQALSFRYDEGGRVVEERTFDGAKLRYEIDPAGRIAAVHHPDDTVRRYAYDRNGRVLVDEGSDGSVARFRRDRFGRLLEATLEEGARKHTTRFERDPSGRIVLERQGDLAVRYAYDAFGRVTERVLSNGATTRFAFDKAGRLAGVSHDGKSFAIARDAVGREHSLTPEDRRFVLRHAFDVTDRLVDQHVDLPGGDPDARPLSRLYTYDRALRLTEKRDARWGITHYEYTPIGRLAAALAPDLHEAFRYDPAGSMIARFDRKPARAQDNFKLGPGGLVVQTPTTKYAYDKRQRRIGERDLTISEGRERITAYRWDIRDRLREVALPDERRIVVEYDALGRRVREEVYEVGDTAPRRATAFLHCGNALIAELASGGLSRVFVHRPDSFAPLLHVEHGEVFVTVCDPVGTPLELIDAAGRVAWSASRGAFGDVRAEYEDPMRVESGKRVRSPFGLLGQVHDAEMGLAWTRFRVFDPAIGSWLSPDPWGIEGGYTPFGFDGAPTIDADPLGLGAVHRPGPHGPNVPPGMAVTVERTPEGLVPTSRPLSPEEAGRRLQRGEDVYAGDRATARAVAGRGAIGPETHPAEGENRFPHFHRSDREGGHVFFGSAE